MVRWMHEELVVETVAYDHQVQEWLATGMLPGLLPGMKGWAVAAISVTIQQMKHRVGEVHVPTV